MEFLIEIDGTIYDISELITDVSFSEQLNDGCSKLEFSFVDDKLGIKNGSIVRFKYSGENIFYGYVFKHSRNKNEVITATAYDQLRYCKAKDTIVVDGDTITSLVRKMCNYFKLRTGNLTDSKYILTTSVQDDKTWLDIIYSGISDTLQNKGEWYTLRDEFGGVALRNLHELELDLILGDSSLAYDYSYEKSIDDNFYNYIKIVSDNENSGKRDVYITMDNGAIASYGMLQYFEVLDKNKNPSQVKSMADQLLKLYNRESESFSLDCLGDTRIRSGTSFYAQISDIKLNKRLIVTSVTHKFLPHHTMSLEVAI